MIIFLDRSFTAIASLSFRSNSNVVKYILFCCRTSAFVCIFAACGDVCFWTVLVNAIQCRVIVLQNALDKNGKTALDLCEQITQPDWQSAANLLRSAMSQPVSLLSPI